MSGDETVTALTDYLDGGGRLILSGQDIGYWDSSTYSGHPYYAQYLHARLRTSSAADLGGTVSGSRFLSGIDLTLDEAALYGYPNTALRLSPDGVDSRDGNAYPILSYDNGRGAAALAVDPCNQPFRVVYMPVGYENLGPRAYDRPSEHADLLERSIEWVTQSKLRFDVDLAIAPAQQVGSPKAIIPYRLTLANTGRTADTYDLSITGNRWWTRIYSGSVEAPSSLTLQPCTDQEFTVWVGIPGAAKAGATDSFEIAAVSRAQPEIEAHAGGSTLSFEHWQTEASMPTPRYRLAAANLPNSIYTYAIGGLGGGSWNEPLDANERYDACSGTWERMAPMPTPRGNVSAAVIGKKIYVPGGYAAGEHLDVLEVYDPESDSWSSGAPLPEPLSGMAVAAYGGKLYGFGGARPQGDLSDRTYVYDPAADAWEEKTPLPGGGRGAQRSD